MLVSLRWLKSEVIHGGSLSSVLGMLTSVAAHVGCLAVSAGGRDSGREKAQAKNEEQSCHHFQNHCSLVSGQDAIDDPLSALSLLTQIPA